MLTVATMVERLLEQHAGRKIAPIAIEHGIDPALLRLWAKEKVLPNDENCVKLADAIGIDRKYALLSLCVQRTMNMSEDVNLAWRELELLFRSNKKALTG